MPLPVPPVPTALPLGALRVGNPVSAAHGQRAANDLAFLLAHAVEEVADVYPDYSLGAFSPMTATVFYARSPGCNALLVGVELVEAAHASATITVTADGVALPWVQSGGLDGSAPLTAAAGTNYAPQVHYGYADVSGLPADGTVTRLQVDYARVLDADGVRRIFAREVPLAEAGPEAAPTTEVGANAAWARHRLGATDGLVDGAATQDYGFVRLHDQLDQARTRVRRHRQLCFLESDTYSLQTSNLLVGAMDTWPGTTLDPYLYTRARRLYGVTAATAQPEPCRVLVRYKCTAAAGGTLRVIVNGANTDFALPAAGGWTTLALATLNLPTSATDQECEIRFHGAVASAGTLYLATIALVETTS